jgi:diguanylate cyclase (GGDEF)-like protein
MRNHSEQRASEELPGGTTERTSDPPPLAGPAAGCGSRRAPETSFEPAERDTKNLRRGRFKSIRIGPPNSVGAELAWGCCRVTSTPDPDLLRQPLAEPPLNAFEYNPTHLVQRTCTSSPLESLRKGAKANHCSRVGEVVAMVALDEISLRRISATRSITTEVVAAIFVSAFLTPLVIASRVSLACMTLSAGELLQIIFSISAAAILFSWIIASRIRQTLTRIELKHQELVSSARIDGLTGLLNRPGFDAVAAEAFEETRRWGQLVSALLCDIDAFRGLNERYGHKAGDRALKNLAEVLEESIGRRPAIIGRHGGDEFVILLPGIDLNEATMIAERLCEACEARALIHQHPAAKFTISVGVGTEASGPSELGALLRQTDAALYRAKRAGGNQVGSGSTRFVQRHSAPGIERFPTRSAKLFAPVTNPGNAG